MLKKTIRRLGALAMVLAMAVSVFAVNASATEGGAGEVEPVVGTQQMTITKNVTKEADVYLPNTQFDFKVTPAGQEATSNANPGVGVFGVTAGEDGSAILGEITSAPADTDLGKTEVTVGTLNVTVDADKFPGTGVYYYKVTEEDGGYDGMKYDDQEKMLQVMVGRNNDGKLEILSFQFVVKNERGKYVKADGVFTNIYKDEGEHKGPHDLTISKSVTGNMGDKQKDFTFTVTIKNANESAEKYAVYNKDGTKVGDFTYDPADADSGSYTFTLKDSESIKITGLSPDDIYTVTEENYASDGYTTKIGDTVTNTSSDSISADTTVAYTNHKEAEVPGGVIMNIAPYALMVVLAGAFAVVFLTRRNRAE